MNNLFSIKETARIVFINTDIILWEAFIMDRLEGLLDRSHILTEEEVRKEFTTEHFTEEVIENLVSLMKLLARFMDEHGIKYALLV